jgi:hypothetical protein
VVGVNQFVGRRRNFRQDAQPAERINTLVNPQGSGRNRAATNSVKTVAAGDEVALESFVLTGGAPEFDFGPRGIDFVKADGFRFVEELPAGGTASGREIFQDFVLRVDRDRFSAGEIGEINAMPSAIETQFDTGVDEAFAFKAVTDAGLFHQIDGALFEDAGANALLDIFLGTRFENDGVDSLQMKKVREGEPGGTCSDDSDLSSHQ